MNDHAYAVHCTRMRVCASREVRCVQYQTGFILPSMPLCRIVVHNRFRVSAPLQKFHATICCAVPHDCQRPLQAELHILE